MFFDWHQFHRSNAATPTVVDSRRRLLVCLLGFAMMLALVFGRVVQTEVSHGAGFREEALRPVERQIVLPASRGRILARDGTVLASDRTIRAVAVEYRWLQQPPDERWIQGMVRSRIAKIDRKNAAKYAAEKALFLAERDRLATRLATLCGLSAEQWRAKTRKIQTRVQGVAERVNARRGAAPVDSERADDSWAARVRRLLLDEPPSPRIVVKEELQPQVVVEDVSPAVVAEIETHAERWPATTIVELTRRAYPEGDAAAHLVGYLGQDRGDDVVGRTGVEKECDSLLQGEPGTAVVQADRGGRQITVYRQAEPVAGRDVKLTVDLALQRTAEELLKAAMERRKLAEKGGSATSASSGGAVVVMDVRNGAVLAAASAPRFDPNVFGRGDDGAIASLLSDPAKRLFDRTSQMAIPPGSAFKTLTAIALLESGAVGPESAIECRGYLHRPDRQRCELFVRQGVGHGRVTLRDALAESCNVYFFHFAERLGPRPLASWADRFGFGRPTGVDLPGEAAGVVPCPENIRDLEGHSWRTTDTQAMCVGQSSLMVTPLQMVRMMAAVANGGWLVTPHVVSERSAGVSESKQKLAVSSATLRTVREGLRRVVSDPKGTAHATVALESTAVAGKTGTAETGEDRASHAWFVGYAPANDPKVAFVVVLEHAGSGGTVAGPVAKRLIVRMEQLGIL